MTGFAWLNELMVWLGKWFPRLLLIQAGNVGVWFGPGGASKALAAGLYAYWPITTAITIVSTRCRTTEIASQLCGREAISLAVAFTITDPRKVLLQFNDVFSQMDDAIQGRLAEAYVATESNEAICTKVLESLLELFEPYGVVIHTVRVVGRGRVIPLKNLNDWAQHAKSELA